MKFPLLKGKVRTQQFSVKIQRDSSVARASFDYAQDRLFRMTLRKSPVVILSEALNLVWYRAKRRISIVCELTENCWVRTLSNRSL